MARAHRHLGCVAVVSVTLVSIVAPACSPLASACADYCERFHECVDSTVDIDRCEDACHHWADGNSDRETKVDKCSECVSDNDVCSDATRRCFADCVGIPVR